MSKKKKTLKLKRPKNNVPSGLVSEITQPAHQLKFDGLCAPVNPGGITIGSFLILSPNGSTLASGAEVLSREEVTSTNNTGEWGGLVLGLREAKKHPEITHLQIIGDSTVVINGVQTKSKGPGKSPHLQGWKKEAQGILESGFTWSVKHVKREFNQDADTIGNELFEKENKERPFDFSKLPEDHWWRHSRKSHKT